MTTINSANLLQILTKIEKMEREHSENSCLLRKAYEEAKSIGCDKKTIRRILLYIERGGQTSGKFYQSELYRGALGV